MQKKPAKYNLHWLVSQNPTFRFSSAKRPQEIFPILLDEVVALGFRKALVLEVDLTNGDIRPAASVNCSAGDLARFRTSLSAKENPVVSALECLRSVVLHDESAEHGPFYACPMIYRFPVCCREAEGANQQNCLALKNFEQSQRFAARNQMCDVCGMRGYAAIVLAQAGGNAAARDRHALRALVNRANQSLSQLFKIDHYFSLVEQHKTDACMLTNFEGLPLADEIVRQDRERLNLVIENVGDPIVVADNSAKIVLLDPLAKELFGTEERDRTPQVARNLAKLDAYLSSFTFSFLDKENQSLRFYDSKSGAEIEYAARSGKIYNGRGQVAYTVTVLRDFSAWKKLEDVQIDRRVIEMEKFAATGRLAGTIAHEINNPLEAIKNAIHLLADQISQESQPIFDVLKGETERVTRIVRQMLGLYRNVMQPSTFDVNSIVEDTLALFRGSLAKAHVKVVQKLGKLPPFKGASDQFRQLLSNLVVNSRDSMAQGGILTIHTKQIRSSDGSHSWISISLADTGTGISPEVRKAMFDAFVTTKGERGTGLGLWIVKGIVENHNGRMRSTVGKGTLIRLLFPVSN